MTPFRRGKVSEEQQKDKPYGFTREMAEAARWNQHWWLAQRDQATSAEYRAKCGGRADAQGDIADRIEALLPPEDEG